MLTEHGPVRVEIPRDRDGSFAPILIPKHERRFTGFDDRIIAMYARGMSVREIQAFLAESYGTEVSPDFISSVTDEVMTETIAWQNRPLEAMYPVVFFDALRVKIRDDGGVSNKAVYLALGVQADGQRDVLGLWVEQTEGAKFWLKVFNDLKTRGCQDILIAVVDGLKGLADAIGTAFPRTTVQTCIVHLIRNSLITRDGRIARPWPPRCARSTRQPARRLPNRRYRHLPTGHGGKVPDDRRRLAAGLGERHAVLRLPARHQASDLHDQRHRELEYAAAQDHQDPRSLPQR